jgi:hypothetical protein
MTGFTGDKIAGIAGFSAQALLVNLVTHHTGNTLSGQSVMLGIVVVGQIVLPGGHVGFGKSLPKGTP